MKSNSSTAPGKTHLFLATEWVQAGPVAPQLQLLSQTWMDNMQGTVSTAQAFGLSGVREVVVKLSFPGFFSLDFSLIDTLFYNKPLGVYANIHWSK